MLNGEVMDLSSPLMASGVTEGCGCEADLCKNEGTCFGTGQCDCTPEFTGQVCTEGKTSDLAHQVTTVGLRKPSFVFKKIVIQF